MSRVALLTQRTCTTGSAQFPAYGVWREAEDVLLGVVQADLVHLDLAIEAPRVRLRRKAGEVLRQIGGPERSVPAFSGKQALEPLNGHYDAVIFLAFSIWDLQLVERLGSFRRYTDRVAVWFFETWPSSYTDRKVTLEPFHAVDDIFVGLERSVEPLAETLGRRVTYLPMATDTVRFGPDGPNSERQIDLIGIGRRREHQHKEMLNWSRDRQRFYLYDSVELKRPADGHRDNLGRWYASSKLATCNFAKSDRPDIVQDLRVIPGRLFEGLAAGAGLLGIPPDPEAQHNLFGRTVVYSTPQDPRDLPDFLEDLLAAHGPAEIAANVRLALRGHDWAHRWVALFKHLDLVVPQPLVERIDHLERRAKEFADPSDQFDQPVGPPPRGYDVPAKPAIQEAKPPSA